MERKGTAVITAELVGRGLKAGKATVREEQVLRMRHGASVELGEPLPAVADADSELGDELALIELSLLRALKHRAAQAAAPRAKPARSATKSRIVAALKTKKK
jgi:hypothetical protein